MGKDIIDVIEEKLKDYKEHNLNEKRSVKEI